MREREKRRRNKKTTTMSGITDSVTTSLTQAYVGHKTDEIKQEVMNLVGMGDNGDNFQDEENQAIHAVCRRLPGWVLDCCWQCAC